MQGHAWGRGAVRGAEAGTSELGVLRRASHVTEVRLGAGQFPTGGEPSHVF